MKANTLNFEGLAERMVHDPLAMLEDSYLYQIVTKEVEERVNRFGQKVQEHISNFEPYLPFPHQHVLHRKIYVEKKRRILIPKARRMGFSTAINMVQLNQCLRNGNFHARIVDRKADDASEKLVQRVLKSWEHIAKNVRSNLKLVKDSKKELAWTNGSRFTASISGRGTEAVHLLHVSELGPIDAEDPIRSDEIMNGAMKGADGGVIVVETTCKGPIGNFYNLVKKAQEVPEKYRTADDWEVLFFAWWMDPRHRTVPKYAEDFRRISPEVHKYCDKIQDLIQRKIDQEQRLWYEVTKISTPDMRYEYPSLLEECWEVPIEGAIYAKRINRSRGAGKVGDFGWVRNYPVYTIWDLGAPENTRCIFFQLIQGQIRIIDAATGGFGPDAKLDGPSEPYEWIRLLKKEKDYNYGAHILPHDGSIRQYDNLTYEDHLAKGGLSDIKVMDRATRDPWKRINDTYGHWEQFCFNSKDPQVDNLVNHLSAYRTQKKADGQSVKNDPLKDWAAHYADAFSAITEAIDRGFCSPGRWKHPIDKLTTKKRKPQMLNYSMWGNRRKKGFYR